MNWDPFTLAYPPKCVTSQEMTVSIGNGASLVFCADSSMPLGYTIEEVIATDCYGLNRLDLPLPPGSVIVDIGANIGVFCVWAAALTGARVVAVEPMESNRKFLRQNIAANHCENLVEIWPYALSDTDGAVEMEVTEAAVGHHLAKPGKCHVIPAMQVEGLTPKHLLAQLDAPVAFMKLDCEGGEYSLLAMDHDDAARISQFGIETHPDSSNKQNAETLAYHLTQLGYKVELQADPIRPALGQLNAFRPQLVQKLKPAMPDVGMVESLVAMAVDRLRPDRRQPRTPMDIFPECGDMLSQTPIDVPLDARRLTHIARYGFAMQYATGKKVLDCACGMGYGSWLLKRGGASSVMGVDWDAEAVEYAQSRYGVDGVSFAPGNACDLKLKDGAYDMAVSFETIGHLPRPRLGLTEIHRVLTPGGIFIVSAPSSLFLADPHRFYSFTPGLLCEMLGPFFQTLGIFSAHTPEDTNAAMLQPMEDNSAHAEDIIVVCEKTPPPMSATNARHVFIGAEQAFTPIWRLELPLNIRYYPGTMKWEDAIDTIPDVLFLSEDACLEQNQLLMEARVRNIATVLVAPVMPEWSPETIMLYDLIILPHGLPSENTVYPCEVLGIHDNESVSALGILISGWTNGKNVRQLPEKWRRQIAGHQIVSYRNGIEALRAEKESQCAEQERQCAKHECLCNAMFKFQRRHLKTVLENLLLQGMRRLVIYGAGIHTRKLLRKADQEGYESILIADDSPITWGNRIAGAKVVSPADAIKSLPQAILISSDAHESMLAERAKVWAPRKTPIVKLYGMNVWGSFPIRKVKQRHGHAPS